jgi:hypothetical protein
VWRWDTYLKEDRDKRNVNVEEMVEKQLLKVFGISELGAGKRESQNSSVRCARMFRG